MGTTTLPQREIKDLEEINISVLEGELLTIAIGWIMSTSHKSSTPKEVIRFLNSILNCQSK